MIFPQIHVTWLCVTLLSILYYVYCNIMWQELDGLTGLLNQSSYLNKTASLNQDAILMVFDLDDFKDINDQHGHLKGDQCLVEVADSIRMLDSMTGCATGLAAMNFLPCSTAMRIQGPVRKGCKRSWKKEEKRLLFCRRFPLAMQSSGSEMMSIRSRIWRIFRCIR